MAWWRLVVGSVVLVLIGLPLALPYWDLATSPDAWSAFRDGPRLLTLARNTVALSVGTVGLALPPAVLIALVLFRSDLPGRTWLRRALIVSIVLPLPVLAAAWQASLGATQALATEEGAWRPWPRGMAIAVLVHAIAGLPGAIWLIGIGLRHSDGGAEEVARLAGGSWRVAIGAALPSAGPSIALAGLWLALQAATEITVTDLTLVRTYAEEVYTQFASPVGGVDAGAEGLMARTVAASIPWMATLVILAALAVARWQRTVPPLSSGPEPPPLIRFGRWMPCGFAVIAATCLVLSAFPIARLINDVGMTSTRAWSGSEAQNHLSMAATIHGRTVLANLVTAAITGGAAAALAGTACWLARDRTWFRIGLLLSVVTAWVTPAPVTGIGLKIAIDGVLATEEWTGGSSILSRLLYFGPSLLPVMWAWLIRLWPVAVAFAWPTVRTLPSEQFEAGRLAGATPGRELREIVWPGARSATVVGAMAVAVLSLGELGASKLVATPDAASFAHTVFAQMHYGTGNSLSAMCLLLWAASLTFAALFMLAVHITRSLPRTSQPAS